MQYSPKLKKAMEEIKPILEKHDIIGFVALADGEGFSEFLNKVQASWSCMYNDRRPDGVEGIRFRLKSAEVGKERANELAEHTGNGLVCLSKVIDMYAPLYASLLQVIMEYVQIEEGDNDTITGHIDQNN